MLSSENNIWSKARGNLKDNRISKQQLEKTNSKQFRSHWYKNHKNHSSNGRVTVENNTVASWLIFIAILRLTVYCDRYLSTKSSRFWTRDCCRSISMLRYAGYCLSQAT